MTERMAGHGGNAGLCTEDHMCPPCESGGLCVDMFEHPICGLVACCADECDCSPLWISSGGGHMCAEESR